ncbi:thioredoxin family protein [Halalkalibaculum sp. DA384]|uniref:thioredoxin family protein n=1 Tax=Halalkalibaculum sp. DA384 TaxID=3373606 RepID=UPI003754FD70
MLTQLNQLEDWLTDNKSRNYLLPLRVAGHLFLFLILMISNVFAIIRWPLASVKRKITRGKTHSRNQVRESAVNEVDARELEQILQRQELVLVDFWAEWCGPCIMMNKSLKRLAESENVGCTVVKIDTVKHKRVAEKYNVKGLPTLLLIRNNEEIKRYAGALSYQELMEFVQK